MTNKFSFLQPTDVSTKNNAKNRTLKLNIHHISIPSSNLPAVSEYNLKLATR